MALISVIDLSSSMWLFVKGFFQHRASTTMSRLGRLIHDVFETEELKYSRAGKTRLEDCVERINVCAPTVLRH